MQKLRAYCLRFCSFAVCFVLCFLPLNAYAGEIETAGSQVTVDVRNPDILDDSLWTKSGTLDIGFSNTVATGDVDMQFIKDTGGFIVDYKFDLRFSVPDSVKMRMAWTGSGNSYMYANAGSNTSVKYYIRWQDCSNIKILVDGEIYGEYFNGQGIEVDEDGTSWLSMTFEDIIVDTGGTELIVRCFVPNSACRAGSSVSLDYLVDSNYSSLKNMRFRTVLTGSTLVLSAEKTNDGLLAGIIEWLKSILESIIQLPSRIWGYVESGLIDLFVPDAEFMEGYKAEWDSVLQDSMGGVYQSVSMIDDFYKTFQNAGSQSTITFPKVNVPVAGEVFEFGGYEVDIVPDEAPFLQTVINGIKLITNAMCTLAVLQAFKRRYERVVSE